MAQIVTGARGTGKVLIHNGFKYQYNKKTSTAMTWRCWRKMCRANIKTRIFDRDAIEPEIHVIMADEHDHENDEHIIEHSAFLNEAKDAIRNDPTRPIKRLYDMRVADGHRDAAMQGGGDRPPNVAQFTSVRSQMARAKSKQMPDVPHDIEDVVFEGSWRETWRGNRFLLHQDNDWGIAIFATRGNIRALSQCQQVYMDATFRTAPEPYEQMFNILGDYHGRVIPLVTALMTNRTVGHYRQVMQCIKRKVLRITGQAWQPTTATMDFEQALLTAMETEMPNTRVQGCYFHFNQSLWRHIQNLGLAREYRNDDRLQSVIRKVMSLGFLPVPLVRNNFRLIQHARSTRRLIRRYPALRDFFDYVGNTYIDGNFRIPLWNVYDKNMDCRTNNNAESFHRSWSNRVIVSHPNIWIYIRHLKDLQALNESAIHAMDHGCHPTRRARRWKRLEDRLVGLKEEYVRGDRDIDSYWAAVSHLVRHY